MKNLKIGVQLWTLRNELKADFKGVMRELAKLGADGVEFAGDFGGMAPAEIAAFMKKLHLECAGIMPGAPNILNAESVAYEYAKLLNPPALTTSHMGPFDEKLDEIIKLCIDLGQAAASNGFRYSYHNHAKEFVKINGTCALDLIYQRTDAKQVLAKLDIYWIAKGGQNPVEYIRKYSTRFLQIHFKDMDRDDSSYAELGNGCIDLAACLDAVGNSSCKWVIYEQDECKRHPLESTAISIQYLKKLLQGNIGRR